MSELESKYIAITSREQGSTVANKRGAGLKSWMHRNALLWFTTWPGGDPQTLPSATSQSDEGGHRRYPNWLDILDAWEYGHKTTVRWRFRSTPFIISSGLYPYRRRHGHSCVQSVHAGRILCLRKPIVSRSKMRKRTCRPQS